MATRHSGPMRLRISGPEAYRYISAARLVVGALAERLGQNKVGQLIRTLKDGTVIRVLMDGTLPIAEIAVRGTPVKECTSTIDVWGVRITPWSPDDYPLEQYHDAELDTDPAGVKDVEERAAIIGWRTSRPPAPGEFPDSAIKAWWRKDTELHGATPEPRRYYNAVNDLCGTRHELHTRMHCGNWDWRNADASLSLTCWASGVQRYGVRGIGYYVYFRGRPIADVRGLAYREDFPEQQFSKVLGMAFRQTAPSEGVSNRLVLVLIVGAFERMAYYEVPVTWSPPETEPTLPLLFPRDEEAGTGIDPLFYVHSAMQGAGDKDFMWCFNASGTEARRIRGGYEERITRDGFESVRSTAPTSATSTGTSAGKFGYFPFSDQYVGNTPEAGTSLRHLDTDLNGRIADLGHSISAGGAGTGPEDIAVDYIGDEPEYLIVDNSGSGTNESTREVTIGYDRDFQYLGPDPVFPAGEYASVTVIETSFQRKPAQTLRATTWGEIGVSTSQENSTNAATATYVGTYSVDGVVVTDGRDFTSSYEQTQSVESTAFALLYADLRSGLFVHSVVTSSTTGTVDSSTAISYSDTSDTPVAFGANETSGSYSETAAAGSRTTTVVHAGESVFEHVETTPGSTSSGTSSAAAVGFEPGASTGTKTALLRQAIVARLFGTLGVDSTSQAYEPAEPVFSLINDYYSQPWAVYASTELSAQAGATMPQHTLTWAFPTALSQLSAFRVNSPDEQGSSLQHPFWFSALSDGDDLYLSMPLPEDGYSEPWKIRNIFPFDVEELTGLPPETARFYPMAFISPIFNS